MVKDTKVREATGVASMFPSEVNKRLPSKKIDDLGSRTALTVHDGRHTRIIRKNNRSTICWSNSNKALATTTLIMSDMRREFFLVFVAGQIIRPNKNCIGSMDEIDNFLW